MLKPPDFRGSSLSYFRYGEMEILQNHAVQTSRAMLIPEFPMGSQGIPP